MHLASFCQNHYHESVVGMRFPVDDDIPPSLSFPTWIVPVFHPVCGRDYFISASVMWEGGKDGNKLEKAETGGTESLELFHLGLLRCPAEE